MLAKPSSHQPHIFTTKGMTPCIFFPLPYFLVAGISPNISEGAVSLHLKYFFAITGFFLGHRYARTKYLVGLQSGQPLFCFSTSSWKYGFTRRLRDGILKFYNVAIRWESHVWVCGVDVSSAAVSSAVWPCLGAGWHVDTPAITDLPTGNVYSLIANGLRWVTIFLKTILTQ